MAGSKIKKIPPTYDTRLSGVKGTHNGGNQNHTRFDAAITGMLFVWKIIKCCQNYKSDDRTSFVKRCGQQTLIAQPRQHLSLGQRCSSRWRRTAGWRPLNKCQAAERRPSCRQLRSHPQPHKCQAAKRRVFTANAAQVRSSNHLIGQRLLSLTQYVAESLPVCQLAFAKIRIQPGCRTDVTSSILRLLALHLAPQTLI